MKNSKGSIVLGGIEKEAVKIYFQEKKKSRLKKMLGFHFGLMSILLLFSYLTGDYNLLLLGAIFSTITITADSATQFESGGAEYNRVARLDDDTFVIAFRDINDNNKGKVIIGTRSGTTVSIVEDSAETFESGEIDYIDLDVLDSTHFIVAYRDITDSNKGKVVACSVSGTTITVGSISVFKDGAINYNNAITTLDNTYFVISYNLNAGNGKSIVGSVSGTTITLGVEQSGGEAISMTYLTSDKLSTTKIILCYEDATWTRTRGVIGTVNTGAKTIAWGAVVTIQDFGLMYLSVSCFDDVYFIIAGRYTTSGYVKTCSVSGTTITVGANWVKYNTAGTPIDNSICTMDSTHFVVSYKNTVDSNNGYVRGGSISGTVITMDGDGEIIFENDDTNYTSICKLMSNYFIVAFKHGA